MTTTPGKIVFRCTTCKGRVCEYSAEDADIESLKKYVIDNYLPIRCPLNLRTSAWASPEIASISREIREQIQRERFKSLGTEIVQTEEEDETIAETLEILAEEDDTDKLKEKLQSVEKKSRKKKETK